MGRLVTLALVVVGVAVVALMLLVSSSACASRAAMLGMPGVYHITTGCLVQVDDRWIPIDNYCVPCNDPAIPITSGTLDIGDADTEQWRND